MPLPGKTMPARAEVSTEPNKTGGMNIGGRSKTNRKRAGWNCDYLLKLLQNIDAIALELTGNRY